MKTLKNITKTLFLAAAIQVVSMTALFSDSSDWSGKIENGTEFSNIDNQLLFQTNNISFKYEKEFKNSGKLTASLGYRFIYEEGEFYNIPELYALTYYGVQPGSSYRVGRFDFSDYHNTLFNNSVDGIRYTIFGKGLEINTGAAFTGLIFNRNSSVMMTASDYEDYNDSKYFGSPRFLQFGEVVLFDVVQDGTLTFSMLTQGDMRKEESLSAGQGLLNSLHVQVGLKGSSEAGFNYNFYLTGETGTYKIPSENRSMKIFAAAAGFELDYRFGGLLKPGISLEGYYSTGDGWSRRDWQGSSIEAGQRNVHQFTSFSDREKGFVNKMKAGNLFYGDLTLSVKPSHHFSASVSSLTLFRAVNGPVSTLAVTEDSGSSLYLGEEISAVLDFNFTEKINLKLQGGVFIPNEQLITGGIDYKVGAFLSFGM